MAWMNRSGRPPLERSARDLARQHLQPLPRRWRHTAGVARRAAELIPAVGDDDPDVLVAAAWLHDIGYAPTLADTGFHPLDGARYLDRRGWPSRIVALVAQHSGAAFVARARGLDTALDAYQCEVSPLADALTYADQTTDPTGQPVALTDRITEALHRHGPDSAQAAAHSHREPHLHAIAARVERSLATAPSGRIWRQPGPGTEPLTQRP